jgi:hypothetical protein
VGQTWEIAFLFIVLLAGSLSSRVLRPLETSGERALRRALRGTRFRASSR